MRKFILLNIFVSLFIFLGAQDKKLISGQIIDSNTKEPLPFASISLKHSMLGTISNEDGVFDFYYPNTITTDTLQASYLGYQVFSVNLQSVGNSIKIELEPYSTEIEEVVVMPMKPEDYILRILDSISANYSNTPFQTVSYYKEVFKENDSYLANLEAVIESYHTGCKTSNPNQHRILLLRQNADIQKSKFMDGWFIDQAKKQEQRSIGEKEKGGKNGNEEYVDFGGPNTILSFDFTKKEQTFLDPKQFSRYNFKIGETTVWQGRRVMKIYFETRRNVDNTMHKGYILFDTESYAIVNIYSEGTYIPNIALQSGMFFMGLSIEKSTFTLEVKYDYINGMWYPKDFHGHVFVDLYKKNLLSKNESAKMEIQQIFFINKIETDNAQEIPTEKQYFEGESMFSQLKPDGKTTWNGMNVLKD